MSGSIYKKGLVVGIIFLFIGIIIPSISGNVVKNDGITLEQDFSEEKNNYISNLLNSDLAAYWNFNEGEGSVAHDVSGNGNHANLDQPNWILYRAKSGHSLSFDWNQWSGNGYGTVPDSPSLDITQEITLSSWVYWGGFINYAYIVYKKGDGGDEDEKYVLRGNKWAPSSYGVDFKINDNVITGGSLFENNRWAQWYHIAGTFDGEKQKLFINGEKVAEDTYIATIDTSNKPLYIGIAHHEHGNPDDISGFIDGLRIYSRALSEQEIYDLFYYTSYSYQNQNIGTNPFLNQMFLHLIERLPLLNLLLQRLRI